MTRQTSVQVEKGKKELPSMRSDRANSALLVDRTPSSFPYSSLVSGRLDSSPDALDTKPYARLQPCYPFVKICMALKQTFVCERNKPTRLVSCFQSVKRGLIGSYNRPKSPPNMPKISTLNVFFRSLRLNIPFNKPMHDETLLHD